MTQRTYPLVVRRSLLALAGAAVAAGRAGAQAPGAQDPWPSLAQQIFEGRAVRDGAAVLAIEAPYRAEDAALVPVGLRCLLPAGDARSIRAITLVIDQNPSPLAAVFTPGPTSGMRVLSTRVRVDSYTNIHAVAEQRADLGVRQQSEAILMQHFAQIKTQRPRYRAQRFLPLSQGKRPFGRNDQSDNQFVRLIGYVVRAIHERMHTCERKRLFCGSPH